MLPENQTEKNQFSKKGRPKKLDEDTLSKLMQEYIDQHCSEPEVLIAVKGDREIAEEISRRTGVSISPNLIHRYRKKHNIQSCHGKGGTRSGSGNSNGRSSKLSKEQLALLMDRYTIKAYLSENLETFRIIARKSDAEIAEEISKITGVRISPDLIYLFRKEHCIESCHGRGGSRPGAGRPTSSSSNSNRKRKTYHKLTIGDYALVQACPDAYDFVPGKWNSEKGIYEQLARYIPKFKQAGLKTYTPVLPFPDLYSKAQKFKALKGQ